MKRALPFAGLLITLTSSIGLIMAAGADTNPFGSKTPAQILSLTSAAMLKAGSVHLAGEASFPGLASLNATLDSAKNHSTQLVSGTGAMETDLVIGTSHFIKGNAVDYEKSYGVENSPLANQWVLVPTSNPTYASTFGGELLGSLVQMTVQMNSLKDLGVVTFQGRLAVAISGTLPASSPFPNSPQMLYISTSSPYLPIGYSDKLAEQGHHGTALAVFSKWGEPVKVTRPATFVTATAEDLP
jgi:hypothetical protein